MAVNDKVTVDINPSDYKILVVDDVMPNVLLLKVMLSNEKFNVITASNGEQAIAQVRNEKPDLILLDVMMPGMTGYEVAEILQKDPTTLMLIFFAEDGSTYTTDATVEGNTITFNPFNKLLTVSYYVTESSLLGGTTNRLETEDYQVAVYGMGTIHSNAIVFTIQYNGEELTSGQKLVGNNITLIAKKKI